MLKSLAGTCTHTTTENNPWWRVDLGQESAVKEIYISNRAKEAGNQLKDFEIRIGNSLEEKGNLNPKCGDKHSVEPGEIKTIVCNNTGRYLNILLPGQNKALTLCEVAVYGMGK